MSRKLVRLCAAALAAAVVLLLGSDRSFGQKKASTDEGRPSAEQAIEKALDSPTTLEFSDTPLSEVVKYLKTMHDDRNPDRPKGPGGRGHRLGHAGDARTSKASRCVRRWT